MNLGKKADKARVRARKDPKIITGRPAMLLTIETSQHRPVLSRPPAALAGLARDQLPPNVHSIGDLSRLFVIS